MRGFFSKKPLIIILIILTLFPSPHEEAMLAPRAHHGVASLGLGQTKDRAAGGAFFIHMRLSIAKFIAAQAEEVAECLIFFSSRFDFTRKHTRKDPHDERDGKDAANQRKESAVCEHRNNGMDQYQRNVYPQQRLVQRVGAVSAVKEASQRLLEFSHNGMISACRACAAGSLSVW